MKPKLNDVLSSIQNNPVFAFSIGLTAAIHLISELAAPIKSLVIQDSVVVLFASVAVYVISAKYVYTFQTESSFAQNKLRSNRFVYAIRETKYLLIGVLAIYIVFISLYSSKVIILLNHLMPPYQSKSHCVRVSSQCRSCIQFLDLLGRTDDPQQCLETDVGGLVMHRTDRWKSYNPKYVSVTCQGSVETFPIKSTSESAECSLTSH